MTMPGADRLFSGSIRLRLAIGGIGDQITIGGKVPSRKEA